MNRSPSFFGTALPTALALAVLLALMPSAKAAETDGANESGSGGILADTSLRIAVPASASGTRSDDEVFSKICGCLSGRVNIRRDAPDFVPVAWTVRTLNGTRVRPRNESRSSEVVTLDLSGFDAGVYLVSLQNAEGRVITRPLNVR